MVVSERTLMLLHCGQMIAAEYERTSVASNYSCAFCGKTGYDVSADVVSVDAVHHVGDRVPYQSADDIRHLVRAILHADIPHCGNCATTLDSRRRLLLEAVNGRAPTAW